MEKPLVKWICSPFLLYSRGNIFGQAGHYGSNGLLNKLSSLSDFFFWSFWWNRWLYSLFPRLSSIKSVAAVITWEFHAGSQKKTMLLLIPDWPLNKSSRLPRCILLPSSPQLCTPTMYTHRPPAYIFANPPSPSRPMEQFSWIWEHFNFFGRTIHYMTSSW